jgi:hypothetical protein
MERVGARRAIDINLSEPYHLWIRLAPPHPVETGCWYSKPAQAGWKTGVGILKPASQKSVDSFIVISNMLHSFTGATHFFGRLSLMLTQVFCQTRILVI